MHLNLSGIVLEPIFVPENHKVNDKITHVITMCLLIKGTIMLIIIFKISPKYIQIILWTVT